MLLLIGVLLLLESAAVKGSPTIVSAPVSINASLGSQVQFNCTCQGCTGQFWLVNNMSANFQEIRNKGVIPAGPNVLGNGHKLYTLTMPASVQLNGSSIECIVYGNNLYPTSGLVYLSVQGLLSEVANPQATQVNSTTLLISYTAPVSLLGVPILAYSIQVIGEGVVQYINTTLLEYNLSLTDPCISYTVSISAWNNVGMGSTVNISDIVLYQIPQISALTIMTEYNNNGLLESYVHFQVNTSCKGTLPQTVFLVLDQRKEYMCSLIDNNSANCTVADDSPAIALSNVTINITDLLEYGTVHHINMTLSTATDIRPVHYNFTINTHYVIGASIKAATPQVICVECSFRINSPSTGCYAVFHHSTSGLLYYKQITKPPIDTVAHDCITTLPNGEYTVSVLDSLSYQEGKLNNSAVNLTGILTISRPPPVAATTTVITNTITPTAVTTTSILTVVSTTHDHHSMILSTATTSTQIIPVSSISSSLIVSNSNGVVSMATNGSSGDVPISVLAVSISAAVLVILLILITISLIVYIVREKRKAVVQSIVHEEELKQKQSADVVLLQCTNAPSPNGSSDTSLQLKPCVAYEAVSTPSPVVIYESIVQPCPAYESTVQPRPPPPAATYESVLTEHDMIASQSCPAYSETTPPLPPRGYL